MSRRKLTGIGVHKWQEHQQKRLSEQHVEVTATKEYRKSDVICTKNLAT